jgi:hypothetical protein
MYIKQFALLSTILLALAGCGQQTEAEPVAAVSQPEVLPVPTDAWLGEWRGVEGLHLSVDRDIAKGAGNYILVMRFGLDDKDSGIYNGKAAGDVITFTRAGKEMTLRATDGNATGLKWLAGKKDCLTVAEGEGYCQD